MKRKIYLLVLSVTAGFMSACTFLDPLPNGSYNDENFELYPELLRGFVDVVYNELLPETYLTIITYPCPARQTMLFTVLRRPHGAYSLPVRQKCCRILSILNGGIITAQSII